ncbi:ubiquitin-related modifier 1 [Neoconidiobolus thromboides FSU 785]|nr:ubiquitin-related modifier 1 [Neoconidiobolus thromboides FSU 785]
MEAELKITVNFSGGMELLFDNQTKVSITTPSKNSQGSAFTMKDLIHFVKDNLLKEREELFVMDDTVRPGILVLINDCDWELEGETDYEIQDKDDIVFISTLHGG